MKSELERNKTLAQEEMHQGRTVLESMPSTVEIESTNICNINPPCVMCGKSAAPANFRRGQHFSKFMTSMISEDLAKTARISLHGDGEPLLNPLLLNIVEHASSDADIGFNSNGLLLDNRKIDELIAKGLKWINISLDASSAKTYRKIRGQDFDRVIQNIRDLQRRKSELGVKYPSVMINMTLMRENLPDVPGFMLLAQELGASAALIHMNEGPDFRVNRNGWVFDYEQQQCYHDPELHDRMIEEAFRLADMHKIPLYFAGRRTLTKTSCLENSKQISCEEERRFFCPRPWQTLLIKLDGSVRVCCHQTDPVGYIYPGLFSDIRNDIRKVSYELLRSLYHCMKGRFSMPALQFRKSGLKDVWNSKAMEQIREQVLNNEIPSICQGPNKCACRDRF